MRVSALVEVFYTHARKLVTAGTPPGLVAQALRAAASRTDPRTSEPLEELDAALQRVVAATRLGERSTSKAYVGAERRRPGRPWSKGLVQRQPYLPS